MSERPLLLVEDDVGLQKQLRWTLDGYQVLAANDRSEAIVMARRHEPAVILLDFGLPPDPDGVSEGLAALRELLGLFPESKIIVITGNQDRGHAVAAVGYGAFDYYQKPFDPQTLKLVVDRAFRMYELEHENRRLAARVRLEPLRGLITSDPEMLRICRSIEKLAPSDVSVLLQGESGTGKEILARALHELSTRSKARFVAINCAAIPENLLESELFGYEKGAFTGAVKQTVGKLEYAHQGTLFLDEIGDLPMPLQAKLLRFLQERVVERLGGRGEIPVDVRILAATHQDLPQLIRDGRFREDLYYRLAEMVVAIPALRDRQGDRRLLAQALMDRCAREQGRTNFRGLSSEAMDAVDAYAWPGNVREMENRIKRAVIMSEGPQIRAEDLGLPFSTQSDTSPLNLRQVREAAERLAVTEALARVNGNVSLAAEALGISRPTLYDLMHRFGLK